MELSLTAFTEFPAGNPGLEPREECGKFCEAWLDALIAYIEENDRTLRAFFAGHLPDFPVMPLEGTYLEWVDISALGADSRTVQASLKEHEKVWLNAGMNYGEDAGRHYLRINIACPRSRLTEGLKRIEAGLKRLKTA